MTVLTLRYYVLISLFAFFLLICVHHCIGVIAVVVEINSIQFNVNSPSACGYPLHHQHSSAYRRESLT